MNDFQKEIDLHIGKIQNFPSLGIQYKDISPIFYNPDLCSKVIKEFAEHSRNKIDMVCGIESRGFLFGAQIARELGVPFIMVRKTGKLPPPIIAEEYDLEYGKAKIEIKADAIKKGNRVLIHDDVLATGGTAAACARLVEKQGAVVKGFSFLLALSFLNGKEILNSFTKDIQVLLEY